MVKPKAADFSGEVASGSVDDARATQIRDSLYAFVGVGPDPMLHVNVLGDAVAQFSLEDVLLSGGDLMDDPPYADTETRLLKEYADLLRRVADKISPTER